MITDSGRLRDTVYFSIINDEWPAVKDRLQAKLAATVGVRGRLMTKRGDPNLWMEVYEAISDAAGFEHALDNAVRELQLVQLLAPGSLRHVECFEG